MKLRIKEEYLNKTLSSKIVNMRVSDIPERMYSWMYNNGFAYMFEEIEVKKTKLVKYKGVKDDNNTEEFE